MATNVIEIFKVIKGYESSYEISNLGRVKSLHRIINNPTSYNGKMTVKEKILKPFISKKGYLRVSLGNKTIPIHQLVWDAFGNEIRNGLKRQIDHIDNDKTNNNIDNLRIVSNRENCTKRSLLNKENDLPVGTTKHRNKYMAQIKANGKHVYLGLYKTIQEARNAYEQALREVCHS